MSSVVQIPGARVESAASVAPPGGLTWGTYSAVETDQALLKWRLLEERLRSRSIMCSPCWVNCWMTHYGAVTPFRIVTAEEGGTVRGIALVTEGVGRRVGPFPVKTRHLGTAGEVQAESPFVEYNRLLVEPGYEDEFYQGLTRLFERDLNWDQLHFDGFHEADLQPWVERFPKVEIRRRESRYANLKRIREEAGGDLLSQLGKSTRSNIRRRLRDYGELDCQWASSLEEADDQFSELVELHQARWQGSGQPGAFAQPRFLRFQHDVMIRGVMEKRVVLFRVRHQGQTVGCLMLLVDGTRLLDYLSGFAPFHEKPSPGLMTHYLCMQEALKRGFDAYDFLVGDKRHKENLSTDVTEICWGKVSRPTWKMKVIESLRKVHQKLKGLRGKSQPAVSASVTEKESV